MVRHHVRLAQCVACPLPGRPRLSCKTRPSTPTRHSSDQVNAEHGRPSTIVRASNDLQTHTCMAKLDVSVPFGHKALKAWGRGEGASTGVHSAPSLEWNERRRGRLGLKGACVAELLTSD